MTRLGLQRGRAAALGLAVSAGVAAIAVILFLIPREYLDASAIFALVWLGLSAVLMFIFPSTRLGAMGFTDDPRPFAAIGPRMVFSAIGFFVVVLALVVSLLDSPGLSFALTAASIGLYLFSFFVERTAAEVIERVATQQNVPSAHLKWHTEMQLLLAQSKTPEQRAALEELAESFRFAASDRFGISPLKEEIDHAIEALKADVTSGTGTLDVSVDHLQGLVKQRSILLQQARSKG